MLVARGWTNNDATAGPTGDKDPPQDAYEYSARADVSCSPAGDVRFSNMQFVSVDPPDGAKDENDVEYDASNPTLTWSNLAGTGGQGSAPADDSQAEKTGPRVMFYEEMGFGWVYPIDNADGTSNFIPGTETLKELHLEVRTYRGSAEIEGSRVNKDPETNFQGFKENARCHVSENDYNNPGGFWQSGFTWLPTGVLSPWAGNGAKDVCQQFDHGGDLYYCPKATTANGLSGKFGNVNLAANACLEEAASNIPPEQGGTCDSTTNTCDGTSCATRCDFTSPGGAAVTGNQAGSRTVMEFTILTKRFQECYPVNATGYKAEDMSALSNQDSCYDPSKSDGHCKRAHWKTVNGVYVPWCQKANLGSFYFTFGDVDQDRPYPQTGGDTGKEGREKLIALSSPAAVFVAGTAKSEGGVEHYWVDANGNRCDVGAQFVDNDNDPTTPPEEEGTCAGGATPVGTHHVAARHCLCRE